MKKNYSTLTFSLVALLLTVLTYLVSSAKAHYYNGASLLSPRRRYQYHRQPVETSFDLVADMFSVPLYMSHLVQNELNSPATVDNTHTVASPRYVVTDHPETNMIELRLELPGVSTEDLSLMMEDDKTLRIVGKRPHIANGRVFTTDFDQSFQLNEDLDPQSLQATLTNGILRIQATKKIKVVKEIPIQSSDVHKTISVEVAEPEKAQEVADANIITTTKEDDDLVTD